MLSFILIFIKRTYQVAGTLILVVSTMASANECTYEWTIYARGLKIGKSVDILTTRTSSEDIKVTSKFKPYPIFEGLGAPTVERSFEITNNQIQRSEKTTSKDIQLIQWTKSFRELTQTINGKIEKQLSLAPLQQDAVFIDSTIFLYLSKTLLPTNQDTWILGKGDPYIAKIERIETDSKSKIQYITSTKNGVVFIDAKNEPSNFEFYAAGKTAKGERTSLICK